MNEEVKNVKNTADTAKQTAKEDMYATFVPSVHRIGRTTMIIGL